MSGSDDALIDNLADNIRNSAEQYLACEISALNRKLMYLAALLATLVIAAQGIDFSSIASALLNPSATSLVHNVGAGALDPALSLMLTVSGLGVGGLLALLTVLIIAGEMRVHWRRQFRIAALKIDPLYVIYALIPVFILYLYLLPSQFDSYLRVDDQGLVISRPGAAVQERYDWDEIELVKKVRLPKGTVYRLYFTQGEALTVYRPALIRAKVDSAMLFVSQKTQCPVRNIGSYG